MPFYFDGSDTDCRKGSFKYLNCNMIWRMRHFCCNPDFNSLALHEELKAQWSRAVARRGIGFGGGVFGAEVLSLSSAYHTRCGGFTLLYDHNKYDYLQ